MAQVVEHLQASMKPWVPTPMLTKKLLIFC
jgi:hypothetical protein